MLKEQCHKELRVQHGELRLSTRHIKTLSRIDCRLFLFSALNVLKTS